MQHANEMSRRPSLCIPTYHVILNFSAGHRHGLLVCHDRLSRSGFVRFDRETLQLIDVDDDAKSAVRQGYDW